MSLFNVMNIAGSALTAQSARLNAVASNLANADSMVGADGQPYRAKQVVSRHAGRGRRPWRACRAGSRKPAPLRRSMTRASPAANEQGYVSMPNVNPVEEMVNMISASRSYQNNVEVLNAAKSLVQKTLAIGQ
jgi:flagellar basal-body rod protein FlgC